MSLPENITASNPESEAAELPSRPSESRSAELPPFSEILSSFPKLSEAVARLGFEYPTSVQAQSLPRVLMGENLVVEARTGSGKTLTYSFPLLAHVDASPRDAHAVGLVVAPTRELALQVTRVLSSLEPEIEPVSLIGGARLNTQMRQLEEDGRIVIGTPGRILDMIRRKALSLRQVKFFALDEADEMLSMGFIEEVEKILSYIPGNSHGMFTSATVNERVKLLAKRYLKRFGLIEVDEAANETVSSGTIHHLFHKVGPDLMAKADALTKILEKEELRSTIVFCNTKSDTDFLEAILTRRGISLQKINSDLNQTKRNHVIRDLRAGDFDVLVATDVAARGLDIDHVDLVVNYSLHEHAETYVHRSGRTGRAGREGLAISLLGPADQLVLFQLKKELPFEFEEYHLEE